MTDEPGARFRALMEKFKANPEQAGALAYRIGQAKYGKEGLRKKMERRKALREMSLAELLDELRRVKREIRSTYDQPAIWVLEDEVVAILDQIERVIELEVEEE